MASIDRYSCIGRTLPLLLGIFFLASLAAADDHGDTCSAATTPEPYGSCFSEEATFETLNDIDVFEFTAPYTATYSLFTTGSADPHLNVRDSICGNIGLYDSDSWDGRNASLQFSATAGQVYYLEVHNEGNPGDPYKVHLTGCKGGCPSDQQEDQIWNATQLQIGTSAAGTIECSLDVDVLQVWPQQAGKHWIHVYPDSATGLEAQLFSGHDVVWGNDNTASEFHFEYNMQPGPYYLQFYVDSALFNPPPASEFRYQVQACTADEFNDQQGQSTYIPNCGSVDRGIDCTNDVDWYRFTASASATYDFTVSAGGDLAFGLFDSNGSAHDTSGTGTLSRSVSAGESIWIEVWGVEEATGAYTLEVDGCGASGCGNDPGDNNQAASTVLLGCVDDYPAGIDCDSDWDWYQLTTTNAGVYTFSVTPDPGFTAYVGLYDATGNRITGGTDSASTSVSGVQEIFARIEAFDAGDTFDYDLTVTGCSTCGDDPGNDNLGDFTNIDGCGATTAGIDCPGDLDYYGFVATTPGSYTFATTGSLDTELRFYDANGDVITTDDNSGAGNNASITWTLTNGVRYYVAVNEDGYDGTGAYALEITGCSGGGDCPADQHGDGIGDASSLSGCGTTPAAVDCAGDIDMFRFIPASAATYTLETTGSTDTVMTLRDSGGSEITSNDDQSGDNRNAKIEYDLLPGITYYIEIIDYNNDDTGAYSLVVSGCDAGCGLDPGNDNLADFTNINGCGTTAAGIDCPGDLDYYGFVAATPGSYTFATTGSLDTELRFYDANGDVITTDDNSGSGNNASISWTLTNGVRYYVAVNENGYDGTGAYALEITGCSGGEDCPADQHGDGIGDASSLSGCGTTPAAIDCAGDMDMFRFIPASAGTYTLETTGSTDTVMTLRDSGGSEITSNDDQSGDNRNAKIEYDLLPGVTYYVEIIDYNNDDTGAYDLVVSGCDGGGGCGSDPGDDTLDTATELPGCVSSHAAALDCAGDWDWYKVTAPNAGNYTVAASSNGGQQSYIGIFDATGHRINGGVDSAAVSATSGQEIFARVEANTAGETFAYDLTITGCSDDGCSADQHGDTITDASSLSGCGMTSAAIDCAGDTDMFSFIPADSGTFTFETTGNLDTMMELQAPDGTQLAANDDQSGDNRNARIEYQLSGGQTYFVKVLAFSASDTGNYTLVVSGCGGGPGDDLSWVVTATAKLAGAAGTYWASDLALFNHGSGQAQVTVSLWQRNQPNLNPQQQMITINPGELRKEEDVLGQLFGINSGAAALHISSNQPLVVASRTYNDTGAGTYGQFIKGESTDDAPDSTFPVYVMGLVETSKYRTNLGLVNPTQGAVEIIANFFDGDGVFLANRSYSVPAQSTIQVNRVLNTIGAGGENHAWASLQVNSGSFFAYISVVDNSSGDPVYRPAMLAPSGPMNDVLDGVAKLAGAAGTNWVTDAAFFNASVADQNVTLRLWRRDSNNSAPLERSFTVRSQQVYGIGDVIGQLFGESAAAGSIEVVSGPNLIADARTYNLVSTGTYGQYIPARGGDDAIADGVGYLCMTSQTATARTNLGLTNLDDQAADVEVRLFRGNGNQVGNMRTYTVRAHSTTQVNRIVEEFTGQDLGTARLEIKVASTTPNGLILAFGSVVDELTGDPVFEVATVID